MNLQYLRPHKAECAKSEWDNYLDRTHQLTIQHFANVKLRAMGQCPGIEPGENRFIDDCDFYSEIVETNEEIAKIAGNVLYAGYFRLSWGHFLMNSTARLWPLFTSGDIYDKIVFFCESDEIPVLKGNFLEFFRLLGIEKKCIFLSPSVYEFEKITIGEIALEIGRYYSSEFMLPFEAIKNKVHETAGEKTEIAKGIILSRSNWNDNQSVQLNVKSIENTFITNGYKPVFPETTSLSDLITLMDSAACIVSFSGSTAHNILFAENKKLIVLERCAANNIYQIGIAKMTGGEYVPIDCFYQPLLVSSTDNLTVYAFTSQFKSFVSEYGMELPEDDNTDLKQEFKKLLTIFRRRYGYGVGLNSWEVSQFPAIAEAYFESYQRYGKYLERQVPVMWFDWFSPRVYMRMLRNLLKRKESK